MSGKEKAEQDQAEMAAAEEQVAAETAGESDAGALEALQDELNKAQEEVLRNQAEMQNLRRRTERDVANAHKFALEKFVGELLPVVDNLERALAAKEADSGKGEDDNDAVHQGIELTLKSFLDVLKRFQVESVAPLGEPFDPELHQAMSMVPNPDMENNTVMDVFQKGYTLNGRLVRPAMVVVVKNG